MKNTINLINLQINKNSKKINNLKLSLNNTFAIGDWCELHDNYFTEKRKFKSLNFYKWNNHKEKTEDTKKILKTYEFFLSFLSLRLNKIHKKNYNKKSWEIILSRWLFTYITNLYARWEIVKKIKKKYNINLLITHNINEKDFIPDTSQHSHWMMQSPEDDFWSIMIFNKILKFSPEKKIKNKYFKTNEINNKLFGEQKKIFYSNVINFSKNKKIFFYNLSLDKKYKILMMYQNSFLNIISKKKEIKLNKKINFKKRDLLLGAKNSSRKSFSDFIFSDLKFSIPKIFVENFSVLENVHKNINWPKNPDYILTSYGQYYDELFKLYCAMNIKKSKLFILQHGYNNIFADGDFYAGNLDKKISDKFLTWGRNFKNNSHPFIYPFHKFKLSKNKSNSKKIILILYAFNEKPTHPLNGFVNANERNYTTVKLVEELIQNSQTVIKENFSLKLLSNSMTKNVENSLTYRFPDLKFINKKKPFSQIMYDYGISIHLFLGTPFFESMYYDKPCILIFEKKMHINFDKKFLSILKKLKDNNICFNSAHEASKFLNINSNNIYKWWDNKKLKKIKKEFCNIYCKNFNSDKDVFKKLFN